MPEFAISLLPDRTDIDSPCFDSWLATLDVEGVPHTDSTGATPLLAMSTLAAALARQLVEEIHLREARLGIRQLSSDLYIEEEEDG